MTPTEEEVRRRLRELDDPVNLERPSGFDAAAVADRFQRLTETLERDFICGCEVDAWPNVQDASFYGTAVVPAEASRSGGSIWVRVSNFGDLAVYGLGLGAWDEQETDLLLEARDRDRVVAALEGLGYLVVPEALLWRRYDGASDALRDRYTTHPPTWFTRFFDWI